MKRVEAIHLLDGCATRLAAIPGAGLHTRLGTLCVEWSLALDSEAQGDMQHGLRTPRAPSRVRRAAVVAGFLSIRHERRAKRPAAPVRGPETPVSPYTPIRDTPVHPAAAVDDAMALMRGADARATPPHRRRRGGTSP